MSVFLRAVHYTDPGREREVNEDAAYSHLTQPSDAEPTGLFIVADGMGGHAGGELASQEVVRTIAKELEGLFEVPDPRKTRKLAEAELAAELSGQTATTKKLGGTRLTKMIEQAVIRANQVVLNTARHKPAEAGDAGSTVTMAVVRGNTAYIANVGDSRTYLLHNGELRQITDDHSLVGKLLSAGQITAEEIYTHPQRNVIYRSLGNKPEVKVDVFERSLQVGDRLLLCSDGLWEMVRDDEIARLLMMAPDPATACKRLIKVANQNGGEDNIGLVAVWIE